MEKTSRNLTIVYVGVFAALIFVFTMFVKIPSPLTPGAYYHLGDGLIFISAYLFSPLVSAITAGLSSALADVLLGTALYAPASFVIKGVMGLICSAWFALVSHRYKRAPLMFLFPMLCAVLIMCAGYYAWEVLFMSLDYVMCLPGALANAAQGIAGIILFYVLYVPVRHLARGSIERIK